MDEQLIQRVAEELAPALEGRALGRVFQLGRAALAFDFRGGDGRYLYLSVEPSRPRLYLVRRTVRELEKEADAPSPFVLALRKHAGSATVRRVTKDAGERVVRFRLEGRDEAGTPRAHTLVVQLTGRSSNLLLLDEDGRVFATLRDAHGAGQAVGEIYAPPSLNLRADARTEQRPADERSRRQRVESSGPPREAGALASLSEALDEHFRRAESVRQFDARVAAMRADIKRALDKRLKLRRNLERDLAAHGDADEHRRVGDLLLANLANAERRGAVVRLTDYYADDAPTVEVEVEEGRTLQEEAERRFARYTKARRAAQEIRARLAALDAEIAPLEARGRELERAAATRDPSALAAFEAKTRGDKSGRQNRGGASNAAGAQTNRAGEKTSRKSADNLPGVRRYLSSDGYEVLVGRAARDNDYLTFRVARSQDTWLHAADYPGSHVVVRNHKRGEEVPHRTLLEAAQLAAHFSQARKDAKVAVHHTQRKFVSKVKGGAPGLVRLSSFRTLMVEPRESGERV